ncbi:MAG: threonine/serine exporter family protein [Planctomycetes bacterium]|nr:threonine/serine exporter family protein [Planctomycetota bacterium]
MTARQFVLELGRAMHALGSPSYRVEDTMDACSRALGLEGAFFCTPTAIFAALGEKGAEPKTSLLRVAPGEHDLGRLADLYSIRDSVVRGHARPEDGLRDVHEVLHRPRRQRRRADPFAHALAGAGAAVLLGGGQDEAIVAAGAGLVVGLMGLLARVRIGFGDVQTALSCAVVAFLVRLFAAQWPIDRTIATVAAIVVLLPGLSFTTALAELSMRHLASGSARLLGTLAVLLTMGVGVGIGDRCGELITGTLASVAAERLSWPWHAFGLAATWCAFVVILRASRRQVVWVACAVLLGYLGARLGSGLLGRELGAFLGALLVTVGAHLFARWRRQPSAVVRTPGLLLLVPGSLGFRGLATAVGGDVPASLQWLVQMVVVGGAIVAGMLMAGVLVPPPLDVEPDSRALPGDVP